MSNDGWGVDDNDQWGDDSDDSEQHDDSVHDSAVSNCTSAPQHPPAAHTPSSSDTVDRDTSRCLAKASDKPFDGFYVVVDFEPDKVDSVRSSNDNVTELLGNYEKSKYERAPFWKPNYIFPAELRFAAHSFCWQRC